MPTSKEERVTLELWGFRTGVGGAGADLSGMGVHALDGGLGKVQEVVERESRTFLVIDTGPWIFGKTIKLPAGLVSGVDPEQGIVFVDRQKDEVKSAPEQEGDLFDETAHEDALTRHYAFEQDDGATVAAPSGPPPSESSTSAADGLPPARLAAPAGAAPIDADGVTSGPGGSQSAPDTQVHDAPTLRRDAVPAAEPSGQPAVERADAQDASAPPQAPDRTMPEPEGDDAATSPSGPATGEPPAVEERAPEPSPQRADDTTREKRRRAPARPRDRAAKRPDGVSARKRAETPSTGKPAATGRKRAETPSRDGSAAAPAKGKEGSRIDQPLARYDSLTAAEVVGRLRALTQSELAKVERYERQGNGRQTILRRVAALREQEPWRGYDSATVKEVSEKLTQAKPDRVTAVRDYERRHRNRRGVMDAARRRLESM